jgi:threonylcarbamoyladenosine tRNA methylthiotransferase MtaB
MDEIIQEARVLAANHQEIVLTGVHIGTYGKDLGDGSSLGRLVERLIPEVEGPRFRLSSVEATEVDERLVDLMSDAPHRLASHLHAPLQSGSDAVLKRMGRYWYTAAAYRERCLALAERVPALGLGADIIVGFPGETDDDHEATRSVIESLPFTYLHVFPYSQRPGASAQRIGGVVGAKVTASRSAELRELAEGKGAAYRSQRDGSPADVVVLRRHKGRVHGLTEDYLDVYLAADREYPPRFSAVLRREANGTMMAEFA